MTCGDKLKPGGFYWVRPVYDVDFTPPGFDYGDCSDAANKASSEHWTQQDQPARFEGYDERGEGRWVFLGQDIDEANWWPVCWVGNEITK